MKLIEQRGEEIVTTVDEPESAKEVDLARSAPADDRRTSGASRR